MRYSSFAFSPSRLVVLDAGVDSVQSLAAGVRSGVEVLILRGDRDGVGQITEAIAARPGLQELHIIAHGCPGSLRLGNGELNLQRLRDTSSGVQAWGEGKDDWAIALYGCQVAAGDAGAEFIEKLHHLTGATISASTQVVGHSSLGGTWELDVQQGLGPVPAVVLDESVRRSVVGVFFAFAVDANSSITEPLAGGPWFFPSPPVSQEDVQVIFNGTNGTFTYNPRNLASSIANPDVFRSLPAFDDENPATFTFDEFEYIADGNTIEVAIKIRGVNEAPVASNFSIGIGDPPLLKTETFVVNDPGNNKSLRQNATDIDNDDDTLKFSGPDTSSRGATVTINEDGTYTYDPRNVNEIQQIPDGQTITDTFQYTVEDPGGLTNSGTVTVQIRGLNTAVVANDNEANVRRGESVTIPVLANDTNIEGGPITILDFQTSTDNGGSITRSGDSLVYRAPNDFIGQDTFSYIAANLGGSDSANVTITVNTPPNASNVTAFSESAAQPIRIAVLDNDSDPDEPLGDTISVKSTDELPRRGGRLSILSTGEILYTAPSGYNGPNRFQYTIEDSLGATDTATVIINPPRAQDDAFRTRPDEVLRIPVLENDEVFSNVSIVAFDTEGLNEGSITRDGDKLVYVAKPGFEGFDYFEYTIEDIDGNRSSAMVEVLVSPSVLTPEEEEARRREPDNPFGNLGSTIQIAPIATRNPNPTVDSREVTPETEGFVLLGDANPNTLIALDGVNNAIAGFEGNDNIYGGSGDDTLFGNQGNDFIRAGGGNNLIFGGAGDDYIEGGPGQDTIYGNRGNDVIQGGSGNQLIFGDSGINRIDGGRGNDTVIGGVDADIITGNFGNDVLIGGGGNDIIQGGDGNDLIFGNQGDDVLDGGRGDDTIYGGQGNDTIYGSAGNNRLKGDLGNDVLVSGSGADSFVLEVPDDGSVDLILNFSPDRGDKLVILGGFNASDIIVQPSGDNSLIRIANTDITLAVLQSTPFDLIGPEDFVFE